MKIPKARQLPSGAWYCRVRIDGQDISITKPTEKEAIAEAMAMKAGIKEASKAPRKKTLSRAIDDYIDARRNVLSPATIRGYKAIQSNRFQSMMRKDIHQISPEQWQRAVNLEAKSVNAKTLTNSWRFIGSVIAESTGKRITVRLPQIIPAQRPWLTPDEIPKFVEAVKGDVAEIPALLALSSLRRSEIVGLRWADIDLAGGVLMVNGSAVPDENHKIIYKRETKNKTSRRTVPIIPPLMEALEQAEHHGDFVVTYHPATVMNQINRVCEKGGFPKVGLHGLRHSFASLAYHLNMPEKVAMEIGGWADDQTMHKIYTHISEKSVATAAAAFTSFFSPPKNGDTTQNGDENGDAK
jgi:integrase